MSDWFKTLAGLWARGWSELNAGPWVSLSTIGGDGTPQCRLVMLRAADPEQRTATLYTDVTSEKISELAANPMAAILLWCPKIDLQVRLNGTARMTTGSELQEVWERLPPEARGSYGVRPPPGTPIPSDGSYERTPNFQQFAQITLRATRIDIVHLSPDFHRRALFDNETNWAGQWRAP